MGRLLMSAATLAAALIWSFAAIAQPSEAYQGYGPHMMWGGGWFGWILGPLMMVLIIGGVIAVVVLLVRSLGGSAHSAHGPASRPDPLDILKERFARGEIDKEEFEDRRKVLGG